MKSEAGLTALPSVDGVISAEQIRATARSIASVQHPDGAIPWSTGDKTDVWNHVEAAMALLVGGELDAAHHAYAWCRRLQRADGTFPVKVVGPDVVDASAETNMTAYVAVGIWHHWLVRQDREFAAANWPMVKGALDFVARRQLPFGGIAWIEDWVAGEPVTARPEALLTGSSSTYQSLRAGIALGELLGDPQPEWELTAGRLAHAIRHHEIDFLDKATFSMDWYYPILGGALRGVEAHRRIAQRWDRFVVPALGARCVDTNPWVTGAETCELVMALDAIGDRERAMRLFRDMQHLRTPAGSYYTGWVWPDSAYWPEEHTTFTAAAVILAADQLSGTTGGADIMVGQTFGPLPPDIPGETCGCSAARKE